MLTPKFWKLLKRDGFLHTYLRGHKVIRNEQYLGGHEDALKPVGRDQFGNTYYEDFAADHRNNRRYVEYSDHYEHMNKNGDTIPPDWDGWLKNTYNDVPSDNKNFVNHFYMKDVQRNPLLQPKVHVAPGYTSPMIDVKKDPLDPLRFYEDQKARKYESWEVMGKKVDFENGRLLQKNSEYVFDESENY